MTDWPRPDLAPVPAHPREGNGSGGGAGFRFNRLHGTGRPDRRRTV